MCLNHIREVQKRSKYTNGLDFSKGYNIPMESEREAIPDIEANSISV